MFFTLLKRNETHSPEFMCAYINVGWNQNWYMYQILRSMELPVAEMVLLLFVVQISSF